ncbi:hypothetical protein PQR53_26460 [Paraburkholderia fungorum]|uniref:hypothetical protein n=1 Tax=Paraburkholderia fungorum TaxID=134537 RepID=UPI0038BDB058
MRIEVDAMTVVAFIVVSAATQHQLDGRHISYAVFDAFHVEKLRVHCWVGVNASTPGSRVN